MDWFSWLSRTGLDDSIVYEYGLVFTRNELEEEDVASFSHEFLQSMGITVAKHRLEILKLARKEVGETGPSRSLSRLFLAINKVRARFTKRIGRWVSSKEQPPLPPPTGEGEFSPFRAHWGGALRKHHSSKEFVNDALRSGPLERRGRESFLVPNRSLSLSGPLDVKQQEKLISPNRSPLVSGYVQQRYLFASRSPYLPGPLEGRGFSPKLNYGHCAKAKIGGGGGGGSNGVQSLWSLMFQDLKPT